MRMLRKEKLKMTRKIIQICQSGASSSYYDKETWRLTALCDDGTLWQMRDVDGPWILLPGIPQGNEDAYGHVVEEQLCPS